jgi:amino acid permease
LIVFAYMYQVNIPMIYYELERRNAKQMSKVLITGSGAAVVLYSLVGIFGYLTFVYVPDLLGTNILEAPYNKNVAITIVSIKLLTLKG